jgi:hypothetical protein
MPPAERSFGSRDYPRHVMKCISSGKRPRRHIGHERVVEPLLSTSTCEESRIHIYTLRDYWYTTFYASTGSIPCKKTTLHLQSQLISVRQHEEVTNSSNGGLVLQCLLSNLLHLILRHRVH